MDFQFQVAQPSMAPGPVPAGIEETGACPVPPLGAAERRGRYGELLGFADGTAVSEILAGLRDCLPRPFCEFDRRGRGEALNLDLYGYDRRQAVAVVQIRHSRRRTANGFLSHRKDYVLVGHNETGTPFRHPVSASAVRGSIRAGADASGVVAAAQSWMWQVTPNQLAASQRQGDVLLVPERRLPKGDATDLGERTLVGGTHEIRAGRILQIGERIYAWNPRVLHLKDQHDPVMAVEHDGWHSVRVADEAPTWDFATRFGD